MSSITSKSIRVNCGDTAVLPAGAKNVKVIKSGTITLTSECVSLADEVSFECFSVVFAEANGSGGVQAFEDTWMTGVVYDGNVYNFTTELNLDIVGFPGTPTVSPDGKTLIDAIVSVVPSLNGLLVEPCTVFRSDSDRGDAYGFIFKTISDVASRLQIAVKSTGIAGDGQYVSYIPILRVSGQSAFSDAWNPICGCKTS